ncbi:MAG: hypothetical protein NVSMB65_14380 [Chloroflexota bacterium]
MHRRMLPLLTLGALIIVSLSAPAAGAASKPIRQTIMHANAAMSPGMWTWERITLYARPSRAIVGSVSFVYSWQTGMTTATVTVMGMAPGSTHPAHIHLGRCDTNGPVLVPFPPIHVGLHGMGTTSAMFRGGFAHKMWYVNVHRGPGMMTMTQAMPIACGNVL